MLLTIFSVVSGEPKLRMLTMGGVETTKFITGEPFVIEVVDNTFDGKIQYPEIKGIKKSWIQNTSVSLRTVNGSSTITYKYAIQINKEGAYQIGPADWKHKKSRGTIEIVTSMADTNRAKINTNEVTLRFLVDNDHVVKGQKIQCTLLLHSPADKRTRLRGIDWPSEFESKAFNIKNIVGPTRSEEIVYGRRYVYMQWQWDMYCNELGEQVIPAHVADYAIENSSMHAFFTSLIGNWADKRVYSNSALITVDALPPFDKPVHAIGTFTAFRAIVDPTVVHQGSALIFSLELEGTGNFDQLEAPPLSGLPTSLLVHDSVESTMESKSDSMVKRFEYVVRGVDVTDTQIPSQLFTYFNINQKRYVTMQTDPIFVSVVPHHLKDRLSVSPANEDRSTISNELALTRDILPLWRQNFSIPWPLFIFLVFLFVGATVCYLFFSILLSYYDQYICRFLIRLYAFSRAKKEIKVARKLHDTSRLYGVFMRFFSARMGARHTVVFEKLLNKEIKLVGLTSDQCAQWVHFWNVVVQSNFSDYHVKNNTLFREADFWLRIFVKLL